MRLEYPPGAGKADVQVFTVADMVAGVAVWTKPTDAQMVSIVCIGPGGGGGSGSVRGAGVAAAGGSGGTGGAMSQGMFGAAFLPGMLDVTVDPVMLGGASVSAVGTGQSPAPYPYIGAFVANNNDGTTYVHAGVGKAGVGGEATVSASVEPTAANLIGSGMFTSASAGAGGVGAPGAFLTRDPVYNSSSSGGSGGGGGGISTTNVAYGGGWGGGVGLSNDLTRSFPGLHASNAAVSATVAQDALVGQPGVGGSGGGAGGGAGANGGQWGGGGGGGGAARDGFPSGKGGDGGPGVVLVVTYF